MGFPLQQINRLSCGTGLFVQTDAGPLCEGGSSPCSRAEDLAHSAPVSKGCLGPQRAGTDPRESPVDRCTLSVFRSFPPVSLQLAAPGAFGIGATASCELFWKSPLFPRTRSEPSRFCAVFHTAQSQHGLSVRLSSWSISGLLVLGFSFQVTLAMLMTCDLQQKVCECICRWPTSLCRAMTALSPQKHPRNALCNDLECRIFMMTSAINPECERQR
jgi:hypothetical protein